MSDLIAIEKRSLDVQAADAIRRQIVSGALAAGLRLTETKLAEELTLSRGTVRAALQKLAGEGLIEQIPYTGWRVAALSSVAAWELFTLRSALEGLAARLAAEQIDPDGRKTLQDAFQQLIKACKKASPYAVAEADFELHQTIIGLARHGRLLTQYQSVEQQIRMYVASSDALLADQNEVVAQHGEMVEAILAGDAARAEQCAREHNGREGARLVAHLKQAEQQADKTRRKASTL